MSSGSSNNPLLIQICKACISNTDDCKEKTSAIKKGSCPSYYWKGTVAIMPADLRDPSKGFVQA